MTTNTPEPTASPTATLATTPEITRTPAGPSIIRIWMPPQFDPAAGTQAGDLLKTRLEEFSDRRSGLRVEVRLKALSGPGGLLDSLSTANAAAPLALPDLILLPRAHLETAALKGLLFPMDGAITPLDQDDWFDYAQELAHLQNSTFGLPFAGDALVMLYRPAEINDPPRDWASALASGGPLAFPAADEQALFTLAQYLATSGPTQDEEGRPTLQTEALTNLLSFFQESEQSGLMPFWLSQYTSFDQAWDVYVKGQANMVISWTSRYLSELPVDTAAAPIPTLDGSPYTLATGWVWALSNPQVERHTVSVELAEFLTTGDFLAQWTAAAGYLPPRESSLSGWPDTVLQNLVSRIVGSAEVIPTSDVLTAVSPALQQATVEVLKEQVDPTTAAQEALERVTGP